MQHSRIKLSNWLAATFLGVGFLGVFSLQAQPQPLTLNGISVSLQDVTAQTAVYYTSMRPNRALNVWNVEVAVSNISAQTISGPVVLVVDATPGSSGLIQSDGNLGNSPVVDLSGQLTNSMLLPNQISGKHTLILGVSGGNTSPSLTTRVFALPPAPAGAAAAFVRTQDGAGQPLGSVTILETGPTGQQQTNQTDAPFGVATVGEMTGQYTWMFSASNYLPVWRQQILAGGSSVAEIASPRLTSRCTNSVPITPLFASTVSNSTGTIVINFVAGSVSANQSVTLTPLTGQTLPAFLPQGWSPLQAFWLEMPGQPVIEPIATLQTWGAMQLGETVALVQWNPQGFAWIPLQVFSATTTNSVSITLPGAGAYALVVEDAAPNAPPPPQNGLPLPPSTVPQPDSSTLTASGSVNPTSSTASLIPSMVTGAATVTVTETNPVPMPSGLVLECEVQEQYLLSTGITEVTPEYEQFIVGYQRPGGNSSNTLAATFPIRPLLLFGSDQLNEATINVDVLSPSAFEGVLLTTNGGQMTSGEVQLLSGAGDLTNAQAMLVREVDITNFEGLVENESGVTIVGAFDVAVTGLLPGHDLTLKLLNAPTNALLVLAHVLQGAGIYGMEPSARLISDAEGHISSLETNVTDNLPGLIESGQYLVLQVTQPQTLVKGLAENSLGQPAGGLMVTLGPWTTLSTSPNGEFLLIAPAATNDLTVTDPGTGDTGQLNVPIGAGESETNATLGTAAKGPEVSAISPADQAINVPQVTSITITFTRPLNPATLLSNSVQLLEGTNPVTAAFTLNLAGTVVTLLPSFQLDAGTNFTVVLSSNITDTTARPLEGQSQFSFSTVPVSTRDAAAQLIVYEPDATNVPDDVLAEIPAYVPTPHQSEVVVQGTPGVADPEVPVILENMGTGETTTVLSNPDGSFVSYVHGSASDIIGATFISLNGARIYTPVTRQLFDDGSVGLYQSGGALQATGDGPAVQITIPPNAIETRTVFKLTSLNTNDFMTQVAGIMPTNGTVAGGALNINIQGDTPSLPLQASFPVNLTDAGYPTNEEPTNAAAMVAVVQNAQEVTSYQVVDQLVFTPQTPSGSAHSGVNSFPRPGGSGNNEQLASGFLGTSTGILIGSLGLVGLASQVGFNQILVPLLFGPRPVTIKGKCASLPLALAQSVERAGIASQLVNLQTGNQLIDVPSQLAQMMGLLPNPAGGAGGLAQNTVQIGLLAFQQQEIQDGLPLSGAFITLQLSGGPVVTQPGRLNPGMVYATSGSDGYFLMVAPAAGANYLITATHPLFSDIQQQSVNPITANPLSSGDLGLSGAVWKNFFFQQAIIDTSTPTVSIANTPVQPGSGQSCQFVVTATQPSVTPTIAVVLLSVGTNDLLTGQGLTNIHYTISTPVQTPGPNNSITWSETITATNSILFSFKVVVAGPSGSQVFSQPYQIAFTGPVPPSPIGTIPAPPTNDMHGPVVMSVDPVNNGFIGENQAITINFDKPIDPLVTNHLTGITLTNQGGSSATPPSPIVRLSASQQTLVLQYPGLTPGNTYQLNLSGQSIQDLLGQPLDQIPSTKQADSFTTTFRTPSQATTNPLPGMANGVASAISGNTLYVLDQAPSDNYLEIYDISTPLKPNLLSQTHLFGAPRDLVVIPNFGYVLNSTSGAVTNTLVAVVGGDLNDIINTNQGDTVNVPGQYLWVFNVGNPASPQLIGYPIVSYLVGSAVTKVIWAPPYLVYQEFGSDIQQLGFVNMQEMIYGFSSSRVQEAAFPPNGRQGVDINGDGSYTGPGETVPIPPTTPPEFYGKHQSYVLQGTSQKILDYSVTAGSRTVGVTLTSGVTLNPNTGQPTGAVLPYSYRTWVANGLALNIPSPTDAWVPFGNTAYPRWVKCFDSMSVLINGNPVNLSLALVSLQPDTNGLQELAVINITLPETPVILSKIPVPTSLLGGSMQSLTLRPDGLLELAGDQNVVLLNPLNLAITNFPNGQLHPAIVETITGAGANSRNLGFGNNGVYAVASGGRGVVVEEPPVMQFLSFPGFSPGLVDPTTLIGSNATQLVQLMSSAVISSGAVAPARFRPETNLNIPSSLNPPNPALHYYVLVSAPGGAGSTIELGLESLNPFGVPLSNLGHGFTAVRCESGTTQTAIGQTPRPNCGAPFGGLMAYRISNDPTSPYYNQYLSRPFALITEAVSLDDLEGLTNLIDRKILFSGAALRAFIEPDQSANPVVGPFAAQIDTTRQLVYPISSVTAETVNQSYILGDNPPPVGGTCPMEDTFGTIQAHSGEVRTPDVDMILPSPHMGITIMRTIGNQDNYEGVFGVGWDFNYNQRLTVLDPLTFPTGLQMPLVVRKDAASSEVAGSQDVLFNNGQGEVIHFFWKGTNMPTEYAMDPLVKQFDYQDYMSDYYLPQHGVFDLLVKYKDGRFERLTPDGMRYRYKSNGQLLTIIDRFEQNHHDMSYDKGGHLIRIDDFSVTSPRFVQFGYYRRQATDPDFNTAVDMDTDNSFWEGKVCQLMDYAGRNVLYQYSSDGFLTNRLGIQVNGENGGFNGRCQTYYVYTDCQLTGILMGKNGVPLINSVSATSASSKPVTMSTTGSHGNDKMTIDLNNTAATVGSSTTGVTMGDGATVQRTFDSMGYVSTTTVMGANGPVITEITSNTVDGLTYFVQHGEGDMEKYTYDTDNPIFRSRRNMLVKQAVPGPKGGQGYTEGFSYDPRYNEPAGVWTNANGYLLTYTLSADGTYVQSIKYGNAATRTFTYNSNGQITDEVDEDGVESIHTYDGNTGFTKTQTSGTGLNAITVTYGYDGSIPSQLGRATSIAQTLGSPTMVTYNNLLQPVQIQRGDYIATTAFNEFGRGTVHTESVGDNEQWISTVACNDVGFITNAVMSGIEVNGQLGSVSYTYVPDPRMRLQKMIYPDGSVQSFTYDNRGNQSSETLGDYTEKYTYDNNNNITSSTQGGDLVMTWNYDGLNRPTNTVYNTGTQTYNLFDTYYQGGQLQTTMIVDPVYGTVKSESVDSIDALGRALGVTEYGTTFNSQFQYVHGVLQSQIIGPFATSTTTFNDAGMRTGTANPLFKMTIKLDDNGRVLETDRQEDNATYSDFFGYDGMDHQTTVGDLMGTMFTYVPRADDNPDSITDANQNTLTEAHSALGELLQEQRADGMTTVYRYDADRRTIYQGDPNHGFNYGFDSDMRMTNSTQRNGASTVYAQFDARNMPTTINLPGGGSETIKYDFLKRPTQRKVTYLSTSWEEDYIYDALNRARSETYIQNGGNNNTATFDYDMAGPLLAAHFTEDSATFGVTNNYNADASCLSTKYPSGVLINETRDTAGRLTGVSDFEGNVISALSWVGNNLPKVTQIGANIQATYTYDPRGRLTGGRVIRTTDNAVLVHMRYQYDPANDVQIREFIHRGGRGDVFTVDTGKRLSTAKIGVLITNVSGAGPLLYQRTYNYDPTGLDFLTTTPFSGPWTNPPPFATSRSGNDAFLVPTSINTSNYLDDPMGNVSQATLWVRPAGASAPQQVSATLLHDGLGHLVKVTRADGVSIVNQYQPNGLRFSRQTYQGSTLTGYSAYVYDPAGRLLEEYDRTGAQPVLIARYYYASGDSPSAADLYNNTSKQVQRYYYLKDVNQSIIAVADPNGNVIERVWYDTFGQPYIEQSPSQAPTVQSIVGTSDGSSFLVVLSEPVVAPVTDPGVGGGIVAFPPISSSGTLSISASSTNIPGTVTLLPSQPGYLPYSVLQFTPSTAFPSGVSNAISITLLAGKVADEWGNKNPLFTTNFSITNIQPGTAYYSNSVQTAPAQTARSSVGSSFLFDGQYFDYDTGLVYLRARYYDPFSGMFFEPDPMGYEQDVNHYAAMGNNPVTWRDPTGLVIEPRPVEETQANREVYSEIAIKSGVVDEHVMKARYSAYGASLVKEGLTDHGAVAIIGAMREYMLNVGAKTIEIALKHQGNAEMVRFYAERGMEQKGEKVVNKSIDGIVTHDDGSKYVADVDGLWIKVDGVILTYEQTKMIRDRANEIQQELAKAFKEAGAEAKNQEGYREVWETASDQFKHGFTANLLEEAGLPHYHGIDPMTGRMETRGKEWYEGELQAKVKKIPDGFTITLRGDSDSFVLDSVKNVEPDQVAAVFKKSLLSFNDRINPDNKGHPDLTRRYDPELRNRLRRELRKGKFDVRYFPIGNKKISRFN